TRGQFSSTCRNGHGPIYLPIVRETHRGQFCMSLAGRSYEEVCGAFSWAIPERFNIATAICDRHVGAGRTALIHEKANGTATDFTFEILQERSRRLANALTAQGINRGDRI